MNESHSCIKRETDFGKIFSFVWIFETCEGPWYFVASIILNVILTGGTIFLAAQRYRYERHIQFLYRKGSKKYNASFKNYIFYVLFHQLIRIGNFLFLVYTNWLQLILSAAITTVVNILLYERNIIGNDFQVKKKDIPPSSEKESIIPVGGLKNRGCRVDLVPYNNF